MYDQRSAKDASSMAHNVQGQSTFENVKAKVSRFKWSWAAQSLNI
jgi:hypothetical protein